MKTKKNKEKQRKTKKNKEKQRKKKGGAIRSKPIPENRKLGELKLTPIVEERKLDLIKESYNYSLPPPLEGQSDQLRKYINKGHYKTVWKFIDDTNVMVNSTPEQLKIKSIGERLEEYNFHRKIANLIPDLCIIPGDILYDDKKLVYSLELATDITGQEDLRFYLDNAFNMFLEFYKKTGFFYMDMKIDNLMFVTRNGIKKLVFVDIDPIACLKVDDNLKILQNRILCKDYIMNIMVLIILGGFMNSYRGDITFNFKIYLDKYSEQLKVIECNNLLLKKLFPFFSKYQLDDKEYDLLKKSHSESLSEYPLLSNKLMNKHIKGDDSLYLPIDYFINSVGNKRLENALFNLLP